MLFFLHDRKSPFVHDLLMLNREMKDLYQALADIEAECERLTPFGTGTRYPGSIIEPAIKQTHL